MKAKCDCMEPETENNVWVAVGRNGNIVDFMVCDSGMYCFASFETVFKLI